MAFIWYGVSALAVLLLPIAFFEPLLIGLLAILQVTVAVLTYHRFFEIEYDYRISLGELAVAEVYHKRRRKETFVCTIADLESIAPYRSPYRESVERMSFSSVYDASSSPDSPNCYYAVSVNPENNSDRTLLLFEPSDAMLRLLSFYNRRTVVKPREKSATTDIEA